MRREFAHIPFANLEQAEQILATLLETERPNLAAHLAMALAECHDPSTVLVRLTRYLEACVTPRAHLDLMAATLRYARLLVTILSQSQFLTDVICRDPGYMLWLWQQAELEQALPSDSLLLELRKQVRLFGSFEAQCNSMRRFYRREILRIAARDLFGHAPLTSVTEDLSNLADAMLQAALESAAADLQPRFGRPMCTGGPGSREEAGFAVVALGKLGGRELNFSSDIDLLFLYSDEGETTGGASGSLSNTEHFHRLGERLIRALSELTSEGRIFRVDVRLRPHGRTGPLATSLEAAIHYYERLGQAWERQALIKARPAAGDLALGRQFIERTRPFVFPRYFDDETLEDILDIKRQAEAAVADQGKEATEVKLGRGGIRDIEFTVQMLQLLNGGRIPDVRATSTLEAIEALGRHAILQPLEVPVLASHYAFLRRVEHRLQIESGQQRHELPSDPKALDEFAQRLGYSSGTSFMAEYRDRTEETRGILNRFVAAKGSGELWIADLLNRNSEATSGLERLAAMGFRDPQKAREEILQLYGGAPERPNTLHVRQQFLAIAPALLKSFSACPAPDEALLRLGQILATLQAPGPLYDVLRVDPALCDYFTTLVSNSEYLTQILIRNPGLFEMFGDPTALARAATREELEASLKDLLSAYDREAAAYRFRDGETLRVGMRDLLGRADIVEVGRELTQTAEVCLTYVLAEARKRVAERHGMTDAPFAVVGLGKLGGRELGYGSDLDLVFVFDSDCEPACGMAPAEYFAAVSAHAIRLLKEPTRHGHLYDIDARLRPDGKKGALAVSVNRLQEYYAHEAEPWERLALVKARAVAGDGDLVEKVSHHVQQLAFSGPMTTSDIAKIEEIRRKIVAHSAPLDLKKDEGGLIEIEFVVRLLQVQYADRAADLRRTDVRGALQVMEQHGVLAAADARTLQEAYTLFRRIENRIRMTHGRSGSSLPDRPDARSDLAKRLGLDGDLLEQVAECKKQVHALYIDLLARLCDSAAPG